MKRDGDSLPPVDRWTKRVFILAAWVMFAGFLSRRAGFTGWGLEIGAWAVLITGYGWFVHRAMVRQDDRLLAGLLAAHFAGIFLTIVMLIIITLMSLGFALFSSISAQHVLNMLYFTLVVWALAVARNSRRWRPPPTPYVTPPALPPLLGS